MLCRAKQLQAKAQSDRRHSDQAEVLKELLGRAKRFRATQLLVRCGLAPWMQYMEIVRYTWGSVVAEDCVIMMCIVARVQQVKSPEGRRLP
jgi:hypothetical protein